MNAYMFQASWLCEDCAHKIMEEAKNDPDAPCGYPQGPYAEGGGEADYPVTCDICGKFLENPLTTDGAQYLREHFTPEQIKEMYPYLAEEES